MISAAQFAYQKSKSQYSRKHADDDMELFWRFVMPDPAFVYREPAPGVHVTKRIGIFIGRQEKGKTVSMYDTAYDIQQTWPYPTAIIETSNPLHGLNHLHPHHDNQILIVDDFTNQLDLMKTDDRKEFLVKAFEIRHNLFRTINRPYGAIWAFYGVHRGGASINAAIKSESDFVVVKSLLGFRMERSDYDYRLVHDFFKDDGIQFLLRLDRDRWDKKISVQRRIELNGYGLWYFNGMTGVWKNDTPPYYFWKTVSTTGWESIDDILPANHSIKPRSLLELLSEYLPGPDVLDICGNDKIISELATGEIKFELQTELKAMDFVEHIEAAGFRILQEKNKMDKPARYWADFVRWGQETIVAREHKENSRQAAAYHIKEFKKRYVGQATEIAFRNQYFPNFHIIAGNEEPDLVDDPQDPSHVIEIKCWDDLTKQPKHGMKNQSDNALSIKEIELLRQGKKVELWAFVYGIQYAQPYACIRKYSVSIGGVSNNLSDMMNMDRKGDFLPPDPSPLPAYDDLLTRYYSLEEDYENEVEGDENHTHTRSKTK